MLVRRAGDGPSNAAMIFSLPPELLSLRYRVAASNYSLDPFDRLSPTHQELLGSFQQDSGFYGILRPLRPGLGYRTADRETAGLLHALKKPDYLPFSARSADPRDLLRLVLDGVLEVEWNEAFLTGPEAHSALFSASTDQEAGGAAGLSLAALEYAESLEDPDPLSLSERLYAYNRLPVSAQWRRTLPSAEAVAQFLRIDSGGAVSAALAQAGFHPSTTTGWRSWQRSGSDGKPGRKLYVSPLPRYLPRVLEMLPEIVAEIDGVDALKVGEGIEGILRPDKCVVYLTDHRSLFRLADRLKSELHGIAGHGVPFTALLTGDGLLSWGSDPLETEGWREWSGGESWRSWVVKRLAAALVLAQTAGYHAAAPIQFAIDRVALEGVNPVSWSPADSFSGYAAH